MSDEENKAPLEGEEAQEPVSYASPLKRVWAWVGIAYMVIVVLLITYMLAYGSYLQGVGPLMVCPAIAGVGASLLCLWRGGEKRDQLHLVLMVVMLALCAVLFILNLVMGVPALIVNFGA